MFNHENVKFHSAAPLWGESSGHKGVSNPDSFSVPWRHHVLCIPGAQLWLQDVVWIHVEEPLGDSRRGATFHVWDLQQNVQTEDWPRCAHAKRSRAHRDDTDVSLWEDPQITEGLEGEEYRLFIVHNIIHLIFRLGIPINRAFRLSYNALRAMSIPPLRHMFEWPPDAWNAARYRDWKSGRHILWHCTSSLWCWWHATKLNRGYTWAFKSPTCDVVTIAQSP